MVRSSFPVLRPLAARWAIALLAVVGLRPVAVSASAASVTAYRGEIEIPTYPWSPPVRHPYFQGTDGRNIYPYPMLDNLRREKEPRTYQTVVLENEFLRLTFLPELGGRVHEVINKTTGQPMFYVNHVIKPGLIGQCGAWISGGIEWNTGPQGHTVSCVQPVEVLPLLPEPDGSRSVAVGETERIYGTKWTVVVTLRPGRAFIEERIRLYNPTATVRPYYFWNCTAVPNTPGFRFIYPMTLGTDHGGTQFYTWPISDGKDLSRGLSYQDASSIFAYECDQDFFGSYDEGADAGVVAYANHHVLVGKKAWTWGHGGYGRMHQMDLTDDDGPYNEVQTGPLPTQADVGRLDPHEAISWQEWWYPIHGLGGFTFANRDLAVNASVDNAGLHLRMIGSGTWEPVKVQVRREGRMLAEAPTAVSPRDPAELTLAFASVSEPVEVEVKHRDTVLARFRVPLDLPVRTPPAKDQPAESAEELAQAGWQDFLFGRFTEAERQFNEALKKEAHSASALTGRACLQLDPDVSKAAASATAALAVDPDHGLARLVLANAELRLGNTQRALEHAWRASLNPITAVPARALIASLYLKQGGAQRAADVLSESGPWQTDPVCRNRLALALVKVGDRDGAVELARANLSVDPLDAFARSVLWLIDPPSEGPALAELVGGKAQPVLDLAAEHVELGQAATARRILEEFYLKRVPQSERDPIACYWFAYLVDRWSRDDRLAAPYITGNLLAQASELAVDGVFPHRRQTEAVLRWALDVNPKDGKAALYLGHLLFALGRHDEGRALWRRAAELDDLAAVACRALGMAARQLDGDLEAAVEYLERAHRAEPTDAIVARDLAAALFSQADKAAADGRGQELVVRARAVLDAAFDHGKGRSDFVALLARAHSRLGDYTKTARLLDSVRITIWEGAREAHDLFEAAHLTLGKAHLDAGRAQEALAEFNRALEYPENLATGRLEGTCDAHIHYLRGQAFAALGQVEAAREAWQKAVNEPTSKDARKEEARERAREALERTAEAKG